MSRPGNLSIKSGDGAAAIESCQSLNQLSRPGKQKSLLFQSRTVCSFHYNGLENAKAGLRRFSSVL
jgi:hypothetical protein